MANRKSGTTLRGMESLAALNADLNELTKPETVVEAKPPKVKLRIAKTNGVHPPSEEAAVAELPIHGSVFDFKDEPIVEQHLVVEPLEPVPELIDAEEDIEPAPLMVNPEVEMAEDTRKQIDRILVYMPTDIHAAEIEKLKLLHVRYLTQIAETMERALGEPTGQLSELNALYVRRISDPTVSAAAKELEKLGHDYDKIATEVSRAIGSDVVVNALTLGEYRSAARSALNDLSVLKSVIGSMEPAIRYVQSYGKMRQSQVGELAMPESMAKLLWILRAANAHLETGVSRSEANAAYISDLQITITNKDRVIREYEEKLEASQRRVTDQFVALPHDSKAYVYSKAINKFLACKLLPTGRNHERESIPINSLEWTGDAGRALRFASKQLAMRAVDSIAEASIRVLIRASPDAIPHVAGQQLEDLGIAEAVIKLPNE